METAKKSPSAKESASGSPPQKRLFILEPAMFCLFFAWMLSNTVLTSHLTHQTCLSRLDRSAAECARLEDKYEGEKDRELETEVQPLVANLLMFKFLLETILPAFISMFLGPWSDIYGRRKVILLAYCGFFLHYLLITFFSSLGSIDPFWFLLASVPIAVTGGNSVLFSGIMAYTTDVTTDENRASRMGLFNAALILGIFSGSLLSGFIYSWTGTATTLSVALGSITFGILFVYFFAPESIKIDSKNKDGLKLKNLFNTSLVGDMFKCAFKKRPNQDRTVLWLLMLSAATVMATFEGGQMIQGLYVRERFGWTVKESSMFMVIATLMMVVGTPIGLKLREKLGVSYAKTSAVIFVSLALSAIISGLATSVWLFYVAMFLGAGRGMTGPMEGCLKSEVAPSNEQGKLNSFGSTLQAITSLVASPFYTWVYKQTLKTFPGAFFFVNAAIFGANAIFYLIIDACIESRPKDDQKKED